MTDLLSLATRVESEPASRELSDLVLEAMGWRSPIDDDFVWRAPDGSPRLGPKPDPTRSIDDIARLEREAGALPDVVTDIMRRIDVLTLIEGHDVDEVRGRATIECGEHREPRCRTAALLRAIAATRQTSPSAAQE